MKAYKFYGQFDPPVDQFLFERYFKNFDRPGILIECGAFDGQLESSCKFFEESLNWRTINVEASPQIFKKLVQNRPNSTNLNYGLSSKKGKLTFTEVTYPGYELCTNGSIAHTQVHLNALEQANCTFNQVDIETITYQDLVQLVQVPEVHLMVLDVEGHEFDVIDGMVGSKTLPQVLCVEHGHLGVDAVRKKIEPLGYYFDTTSFVNSFFVHKSSEYFVLQAFEAQRRDNQEIIKLQERAQLAEQQLQQVLSSKSWKITKPLRWIVSILKGQKSL